MPQWLNKVRGRISGTVILVVVVLVALIIALALISGENRVKRMPDNPPPATDDNPYNH